MNSVMLSGNLVDSPVKVKYGKGDSFLVNFRMGNNEMVKGESVSNGFFDVTVFGQQALNILHLKKGERVVVTGRLQHSTYETADGRKGGRTKIIASEVGVSGLFEAAYRGEPQASTEPSGGKKAKAKKSKKG